MSEENKSLTRIFWSNIINFKFYKMNFDLLSLEVDVLNRLYKAKEKELESAILSGTSWDEVSIRRKALLELSSALHTKLLREEMHTPRFPTRPDADA